MKLRYYLEQIYSEEQLAVIKEKYNGEVPYGVDIILDGPMWNVTNIIKFLKTAYNFYQSYESVHNQEIKVVKK